MSDMLGLRNVNSTCDYTEICDYILKHVIIQKYLVPGAIIICNPIYAQNKIYMPKTFEPTINYKLSLVII